jgi:hypothetical protein
LLVLILIHYSQDALGKMAGTASDYDSPGWAWHNDRGAGTTGRAGGGIQQGQPEFSYVGRDTIEMPGDWGQSNLSDRSSAVLIE